jgi:hypothetical protein
VVADGRWSKNMTDVIVVGVPVDTGTGVDVSVKSPA